MIQILTANFATRREAELAIEQVVQAHNIDRRNVTVGPEGSQNTAGDTRSGSDEAAAPPSPDARDDAALNGPIAVSVQVRDQSQAEAVRQAFADAGGHAA